MAVNPINGYYKQLFNNMYNQQNNAPAPVKQINQPQDSENNPTKKNDSAKDELTSSVYNLNGYLNYNATGNYSNLTPSVNILNPESIDIKNIKSNVK